MEGGLAGAPGLAVINLVEADGPSELALARVHRLKTEAASVRERRIRSNPATPDPAVRHHITKSKIFRIIKRNIENSK